MTAAILHIDLDALPPLSPLAGKLLRLDWNDEASDRHLVEIIRSEPQLSARIVGLANSVAFAAPGGRPVSAVEACLQRIGVRRAALLSVAALFGHAVSHQLPARAAEALWLHALAVAHAAQEIARLKRLPDLDTAYLLGLLHDLGYFLIEYSRAGSLDALADATVRDHITQEEAEHRLFGADHAELTRRLLEHWELPDELIEPIRVHHHPGIDPQGMAALILGAEHLARAGETVAALYADLGHPFAPLAVDRLGLETLFDDRLALSAEVVDGLLEGIIAAVASLRECARVLA